MTKCHLNENKITNNLKPHVRDELGPDFLLRTLRSHLLGSLSPVRFFIFDSDCKRVFGSIEKFSVQMSFIFPSQ
jgi:hypothetical protein